jgi:hypothetical protein
VTGNEIANGPHAGIIFSGNDHHIVANVLHHLVHYSDDAGAIYAGSNWRSLGTIVTSNYFHDINNHIGSSFVRGVYLDDQLSGTTIGNYVFVGVDEAILVGGGHHNIGENSLRLRGLGPPVRVEKRGFGWETAMVRPDGVSWKSVQFDAERPQLYSSRYPGFGTTLSDWLGVPFGNRFTDSLAGKGPVIAYEADDAAGYGNETGTEIVGGDRINLSASAQFPPANMPSCRPLEETRKVILTTLARLQLLPFGEKTLP